MASHYISPKFAAGLAAGQAARATEQRKHDENDAKCKELGWICVPMVVEAYGAWGTEAMESFSLLVSRLATSSNRAKAEVLAALYGRLNLNLVRANATAILSISNLYYSPAVLTGTQRHSYQQLQRAAEQVQSILKDVGVKPTQLVAICIRRSAALVAAMLGCVLHGTAFQLIDTSLPAQRVKLLLQITKPCVLLYTPENHSNLELALSACTSILPLNVSIESDQNGFYVRHQWQEGGIMPSKLRVTEKFECGDDVLYVIFTSGSTGAPKAVCVPVSGTLNRFEWMWKEYTFTSRDVACFKTSVNFADYIWEVFGALLKGIPLVVPLEEETKDPRLLAGIIMRFKVTRVTLVPSYIRYLLEYAAASDSLKSLTHCISSGEPLSLSLATMFLNVLPSCRLLNLYGTSEISADITYFEVTAQYVKQTGNSFVPIGKPIANIKIDVIDPTTGDIISSDSSTPGELVTYGVCVANSYLNSDDRSLVTSGLKSFNTHDLVYYNSSGDLIYIGRRDHQIKVRGVRINPSEIEAVLEKNGIIERAVVTTDESRTNLIGFIQISMGHYLNKEFNAVVEYVGATFFSDTSLGEGISTELLKLLPQYLVPSLYIFTHRLPTLPSGKVSRKELPPLSEIRKLLSKAVNETKPLSKTEEQLCSIIRKVLQLSSITLLDNFFSLGGNSLSAIELASGIEETLHCSIPVSTIISSPTIQTLAIAIDDEITKNVMVSVCSNDVLDPSTNDSTGPLTLGQEMVLAYEAIADCEVYVINLAARCLEPINAAKLQDSVHRLAVNHESLRTLFPCMSHGEHFQKILSPDSSEFLKMIASSYSVIDCLKECTLKFSNGQVSLPELHCNPREGPLWKFILFTNVVIPGEIDLCSILAFQVHHIITDGWSMRVLLADLEDTYTKSVEERAEQLNPSKLFFSIKQAITERKEKYDELLQFWGETLRNTAFPLFLHPNCIPSWSKNHDAVSIHSIFKTPVGDISSFCQANSMTEFVFTCTSLVVAAYALNGTQDVIFTIPNANRNSDNKTVTGFLDNCFPLKIQLNGKMTLQLLLQKVKSSVLEVMEKQIPYSQMDKELCKHGKILPSNPIVSGIFDQLLFVCDYKYSTPFSNSMLFKSIPTMFSSCDMYLEIYTTIATDHLDIHTVYSDDLFDSSTIHLLLKTWERVVEIMVKHVYLNVPLKLLCQDLHIPYMAAVDEEEIEDNFHTSTRPFTSNEDAVVGTLNNETITWQQLSSIQQSSCHAANSIHSITDMCILNRTELKPKVSFGVFTEKIIMKSKWNSDVTICSHLATKYFSEVHGAAVLVSPESSTFPIAISLLLQGIPVNMFTHEYLDSFMQSVSRTGPDMLVIPENIVPSILPKIVECKNIKHLWIQGLPLGLAYISNWMAASQHMQVIVTHSLMHEHHLITHHLNLKDIPSIEDGSIPCIPIGRMCQGLNGKVLHRDGREVYQGFVGNFATVNDSQVHRSTSLVRQLPKDGSFELVSVNAEAYYKGVDVTPALLVLSTIPEVSWCGVSQGNDKESTAILYSTPDVESSRHKIRETVLSYLSLSYLTIIYPLAINPPITPDFTLDLGKLSFSGHDSLLGPPMFSCYNNDEDVDKIVRAVSKAFGLDSETVRKASDLCLLGAKSGSNIIILTNNLNAEFKGNYSISEVYQAVKDGCLVELVRSRRQGTL
eukprot:Em0015g519a